MPIRTEQQFDGYGSKLQGNVSRSHHHALNDVNPQKLLNKSNRVVLLFGLVAGIHRS